MSTLQDAIDSLAAIVLQNRRGLDLITVKEGSMCATLHRIFCFYKNQSGLIQEGIKEFKKSGHVD